MLSGATISPDNSLPTNRISCLIQEFTSMALRKWESPESKTAQVWFTVTLIGTYLATFQLWMEMTRPLILASGLVVVTALSALLLWSAYNGYFGNRWDAFWHATVIIDLALEAVMIKEHDNRGFYFCALAFAIVVGGYHHRALLPGRKLSESRLLERLSNP